MPQPSDVERTQRNLEGSLPEPSKRVLRLPEHVGVRKVHWDGRRRRVKLELDRARRAQHVHTHLQRLEPRVRIAHDEDRTERVVVREVLLGERVEGCVGRVGDGGVRGARLPRLTERVDRRVHRRVVLVVRHTRQAVRRRHVEHLLFRIADEENALVLELRREVLLPRRVGEEHAVLVDGRCWRGRVGALRHRRHLLLKLGRVRRLRQAAAAVGHEDVRHARLLALL
mmetsp:Transcript_16404/g.32028  ORF Transcript_16404/g.32028 Transcript_16404/m.32028 type:complete len:227 (-) Transcript_16404:192-872(-)